MNKKLLSLKSVALAALLFSAAAAQAQITVYNSQAAFLAAVTAPGTDTYDDLPSEPMDMTLARVAGSHSYLASAGPSAGFFPAGSDADRWLSTSIASDSITFSNFSAGVYALGGFFFGSDVLGNFAPGSSVTLTASSGATETVILTDTTTATFLGFSSDTPLVSVVLSVVPNGNPVWPTANDLTLAVPEPETYGMLLAGLGLLGFMARRRAV